MAVILDYGVSSPSRLLCIIVRQEAVSNGIFLDPVVLLTPCSFTKRALLGGLARVRWRRYFQKLWIERSQAAIRSGP